MPVLTSSDVRGPLVLNEGGPDDRRPGRRDGPPDLEELWRDLNRRISGLFGGKKGPTGPRPPNTGGNGGGSGFHPDGRSTKAIIGIVVAVVFAIWLASGFFIVQEGQTGVILQFGRYKAMTGAGIQWRWPYPIQSHEVVNISGVRTVAAGYTGSVRTKVPRESLMLTDDENIIDLQMAIQYRLKDAAEYLFVNKSPDEAVKQAAETSVREVVGRSKMDTVLYEGREQVAIQVSSLMQQILDRYKTGILITSVTVQSAQPPEQVQASFDDAVKAGQDRERSKNEGQAYANDVIPRARGNASRLLQEAAGYKQNVIARAEGDASRFGAVVAEYSKAPAVTRQRMYIDTMQEIYANAAKVMVDARAAGNLLMLPLDKLLQQTAQDANARAAGTSSASPSVAPPVSGTTAPATETDPRSREGLRNRDRDVR
ncbi:MAG: FtsH protease activity modulator HflK [Burkholderiaceae bacterium]